LPHRVSDAEDSNAAPGDGMTGEAGICACACFLATAMGLVRLYRGWRRPELCIQAAAWLCTGLAVAQVPLLLTLASRHPWADARLAPTLALWKGYPLYSRHGPVSGFIYGPLAAVAYLPAVVFGGPPSTMLASACAVGWAWAIVPALYLIVRESAGNLALAGIMAVGFVLCTTHSPSLGRALYGVHADAPALGLAACALAGCIRVGPSSGTLRLALIALAAVGAVFAKQVMIFVPLACLMVIAGRTGRLAAVKFIAACLGWAFLGLVLVAALQSFDDFYFNVITIPAGHPWALEGAFGETSPLGHLGSLLYALVFLGDPTIFWLAPALILICWLLPSPGSGPQASSGWRTALVFAVLGFPMAVLGRAKIGGAQNVYSVSSYFLALALFLKLIEIIRTRENVPAFLGPAAVVASLVAWCVSVPKDVQTLFKLQARQSPSDQAYEYNRLHPGRMYFPWQPMAALANGGPTADFSYGLFDRDIAGYPVDPKEFESRLPRSLVGVALPKVELPYQPDYAWEKYLKAYNVPEKVPELLDFMVVTRPP
jgi:hypothetical protein